MTDRRSAYIDALHMLGRRELSVAECRSRLAEREHTPPDIDEAIARLLDTGALNDQRVARAFARTSVNLKGRGRLRVQRELQAKGIDKDVAAGVLADVFDETDERSLIARALQKRLRGRTTLKDRAESGRLFQYLMRQGFASGAILAEFRRLKGEATGD